MTGTAAPRVWVVFHPHARSPQGMDDPGLHLEGFPTIKAATTAIGRRFGIRQGETYYLHPDHPDAGEEGYREWPDLDKETASAEVWLKSEHPEAHPGWMPDATSQPDERWTPSGLLGVERDPY